MKEDKNEVEILKAACRFLVVLIVIDIIVGAIIVITDIFYPIPETAKVVAGMIFIILFLILDVLVGALKRDDDDY